MKTINLGDVVIFVDDIINIYKNDNGRYFVNTKHGKYLINKYTYEDIKEYLKSLNEKTPKEDNKIKRIEERESGWWPNMADGNVSTLKQAINEIIDRLNGEDNDNGRN